MNNINSDKQFQFILPKALIILVLIFFVMGDKHLLLAQTNDTVLSRESEFIKQISSIAETLDVFPIDFIANQGALTIKSEGRLNTIRVELTPERFIQFYYFCDMALHTSRENVSDCIDYLDKSTAREKVLILTTLYVYSQTYSGPIPKAELEKHLSSLRFKETWLSMMIKTGSFDFFPVKADKKNNSDLYHCKQIKEIIGKYVNESSIAFPAITHNHTSDENCYNSWIQYSKKIMKQVDELGIDRNKYIIVHNNNIRLKGDPFPEAYQQEYFDKIVKLYPEKLKNIRAEFAYATYFFRRGYLAEGSGPIIRNCSSTPKTVSDIAKQLLESWESKKELPNQPSVDSNIHGLQIQ